MYQTNPGISIYFARTRFWHKVEKGKRGLRTTVLLVKIPYLCSETYQPPCKALIVATIIYTPPLTQMGVSFYCVFRGSYLRWVMRRMYMYTKKMLLFICASDMRRSCRDTCWNHFRAHIFKIGKYMMKMQIFLCPLKY